MHTLHGGPPSIDGFAEVDFLALYFCVEYGLVGLPVHLFKDLSCPSCFLWNVLDQWRAVHVSCYLRFQFLVVDDTVGGEVCLDYIGKHYNVCWSLGFVRVRVYHFGSPVVVYVT